MTANDRTVEISTGVEFLTVAQLAPSLHASPRTVRRACARGDIPAFKRGRTWLVPASALDTLARMLAVASARHLLEVSAHSATAVQHERTPGGTGRARGLDTGARGSPHKKDKGKAGVAGEVNEGNEGTR